MLHLFLKKQYRLFASLLAALIIMASSCSFEAESAETADAAARDTGISRTDITISDDENSTGGNTAAASADEASVDEAGTGEIATNEAGERVLPSDAGATGETSTAAPSDSSAASSEEQEPAICGVYVSAESVIPDADDVFDYIYISQFDDGGFQVEFMLAIGGSGNDYAVFDTEALGTANWYSFYFDGDMGVPMNNGLVTVTANGSEAWVTYEDGEPQRFIRDE